MTTRKCIFAVALILSLVVASPFAYVGSHGVIDDWLTAPYDAGYRQLQVGMTMGDVERLMGQPDDVTSATKYSSRAFDIDTFYRYKIKRRFRPPVKWHIGIDSRGHVASLHRDDNGC